MSKELSALAQQMIHLHPSRRDGSWEEGVFKILRAYLDEHPEDDEEPITDKKLLEDGWSENDEAYTKLLHPINDKSAIIEVFLYPPDVGFDFPGWAVNLIQGLPHKDKQNERDDYVAITSQIFTTMGHLRRFMVALGG